MTDETATAAAETPTADPVQTELPITAAPQVAPKQSGPDAMQLAEILADNKTMAAKIAELTAVQGRQLSTRRSLRHCRRPPRPPRHRPSATRLKLTIAG